MDIQDSIDQRGYNQTENSLDLNNQGTGANPVDQESIDKQGNNHTENPVDLNNQGTGENSSNLVDPSEPETVVVIRSDETGENEESFRPSAKANKVLEEDEIEVKELKDDQKQHSCVIDVKYGGGGGGGERVCRICYLSSEQSPVTSGSGSGSGSSNTGKKGMELIELGCGCKDELGIVHSHCAETWFKLKGNKMCEICGETAKNITGIVGEERFMEEWNERNGSGANSSERSGGCWRGQPFCNFLTACLVVAFVLLWFFHVNMF